MFDESAELTSEDFGGGILPVQYFNRLKRGKVADGECRLLLAVLEQAVRSYLANMNAGSRERRVAFEEVHRWFYSPSNTEPQGLFAFESICDMLGFEADLLRRRLRSISICNLPTRRQPARRSLAAEQLRARR